MSEWEQCAWSFEAAEGLDIALKGYVETIAEQVATRRVQLWKIDGGRSWCVTRIVEDDSDNNSGLILVVVGYQGKGLQADALELVEAARKYNCVALRFHSRNPAVEHICKKAGLEVIELERVCLIPIRGNDGR